MTVLTASKTKLLQVNLYVETSYDVPDDFIIPEEYEDELSEGKITREWVYRLENNLPDYNLHFLTTETVRNLLRCKEARSNCQEIETFFQENKENIAHIGEESSFSPEEAGEYGCPDLDNDITKCWIAENWCGYN